MALPSPLTLSELRGVQDVGGVLVPMRWRLVSHGAQRVVQQWLDDDDHHDAPTVARVVDHPTGDSLVDQAHGLPGHALAVEHVAERERVVRVVVDGDVVADHLLAALERGDFYVLCPDNEVTPEMDRKRVLWAAGDIAENRPALSRWHPDWKDAFEAFEP